MKKIPTFEPLKKPVKVEIVHDSPERQKLVKEAHDKIQDNKGPYAGNEDRY
jgi:hypothetical protein